MANGAGAFGRQTGLEGPNFNGSSFQIGEVGYAYRAGPQKKPGNFGVGLWGQTGSSGRPTTDAPGHRCPGGLSLRAHRLWFRHPGVDNSGVSGFYQFGANNSNALPARQYVGGGLTAFGLVPGRPDDSFGFGVAQTWLNTTPGAASFFHLDDNVSRRRRTARSPSGPASSCSPGTTSARSSTAASSSPISPTSPPRASTGTLPAHWPSRSG